MNRLDADVHVRWSRDREMLDYLPKTWHARWLHGAGHSQSGLRIAAKYYDPSDAAAAIPNLQSTNPGAVDQPADVLAWLDAHHLDAAVLSNFDAPVITTFGDTHYPGELARMHNRWLADRFLAADPRLLGSIVVATQDPAAAAEEIRRAARHPGMVQVLLPTASQQPYGNPRYRPIFAAAAECGLAIALHAGTEGSGTASRPTPNGWPLTVAELRVTRSTHAMGHLTSLVTEGTFTDFPDLRVVCLETGVAWLPTYIWRFDKNYKGLRSECPWLRELPSALVSRVFRFGTQGCETPDEPAEFWRLLRSVDPPLSLLFASNHPRWDEETPTTAAALRGCDADLVAAILAPGDTYPRLAGVTAAAG